VEFQASPFAYTDGKEEEVFMKMSRFILSSVLLVTLGAGALFAEGRGEKGSAASRPISWWALSGGGGADDIREAFRREVIAEFEAANPGVKIDLVMLDNESFKQKVQVAIQAGNPPDIFHSWGGGVMVEYAEAGMLRDITNVVKNDLSKTVGLGALGVYGNAGKYYGAPYDMGAVGLWYNTKIFADLGLDFPKTFDELLAIIPVIKNAGITPIALGAGDRWPAHFWWVYLAMRMGGKEAFDRAYDGRGSFKDPTFVEAGRLLNKLRDTQPFQTGFIGATYDDQGALMGNGRAAMELMGQWAPATQEANSVSGKGIGSDLKWAPFPAVAGGKGALTDVMGGGNGYVLGKDASDKAVEFFKFFMQRRFNERLVEVEGIIPVVKGAEAAIASNANQVAIVEAISKAQYYQLYYDQFLPPAVGEAVKDAVAGLLAGKLTPEQCAADIDASWQRERK